MAARVYVFWDNSNIFIPAQEVAARREGPIAASTVRLHFEHLYRLAVMGRTVANAFCVGSVPPDLGKVWKRLKTDTGANIELFERGQESGTEQAIDQALQVRMLRALADEDEPQIAVLMTGDGAGYLDGVGFHADLERMQKRGWGIEVLSWDEACNNRLKEWAKKFGVYVPLEMFYWQVTFTEGGRVSKLPKFNNRSLAQPRPASSR